MFHNDDLTPASPRQAAGGLLFEFGGPPSPPGGPPAPLPREDQIVLDLIEAGARAQHERQAEIARDNAVSRESESLRAMIAPRYQAVMAQLKRKSERTEVAYFATFRRFYEDCLVLGVCHLPASAGVVAAYLENLRDCSATASHLRREKAAIAFVHNHLEYPDPTHDPLVAAIIHDAYRAEKEPKRHVNGKH